MPTVEVSDGTKIDYCLDDFTDPWEETETIVIAHGAAEGAKLLYRLVPGLARRYRVIRINERGTAWSPMPAGSYKPSFERFAEDVLNIIDQAGLQKIHFFGQHSGGWVGMRFAIAYPDRIRSLILCNSPYTPPPSLGLRFKMGEKDIHTAVTKFGVREYFKQGGGSSLPLDPRATPEMLEWYHSVKAQNPPEVVSARFQFGALSGFDYKEHVLGIKVPTLIITGANCNICPPEMAVEMQKRFQNAQLAVIENVGAYVTFIAPERCVEAIINFHQSLS